MINWMRVDELCEEFGADDFAEVVDLFLTEVEAAIGSLESAAGNAVVTMEQMHFLKGAALNLGFALMADVCATGEQAAKQGDVARVPPDDVREAFENCKTLFETELPRRIAA